MWLISIYCFLHFLHQLSILISSHNSKYIVFFDLISHNYKCQFQLFFIIVAIHLQGCTTINQLRLYISQLHLYFSKLCLLYLHCRKNYFMDFETASWNFSICIAFIFCISVSQSWWEGRRMKTSARPPNRSWHHHRSSSAN